MELAIAAALILAAPVRDHLRRSFQVKLETVHVAPDPERLVRAPPGRGQQLRACRQIEHLAVPVKHGFARTQTCEHGIVLRGGGEIELEPPDLLDRVYSYFRAQ